MIRECEEHGYFRAENCPFCGEEGKYIMSDAEVERIGRSLAGILRHGKYGLEMDSQGFVSMRDIINTIRDRNPRMGWLRVRHLEALINTDPKGRYAISGSKVRATYGHTLDLDLNLDCRNIPEMLFYPVDRDEAESIVKEGLFPSDRAMVHLSLTYNDAVRAGSVRMDDPTILMIDTEACIDAGFPIGHAAKTVYLCKEVPPEALYIADPADFVYDEQEDDRF
ncbi:MAG: RNA 2'-phosphotransferase [Candidatus Methanomethylophilaceae archaeon]|nr:RNA 2'-phosphotransferase [Candidatus Methanomethylophilaceae archaeon]